MNRKTTANILVRCGYGIQPDEKELHDTCICVKDDNWPSQSGYRIEGVDPENNDSQLWALADYFDVTSSKNYACTYRGGMVVFSGRGSSRKEALIACITKCLEVDDERH